jgi:hypothetical protein
MIEAIVKDIVKKLSIDEYNICLSKKNFVKIRGQSNSYSILDITHDNLGDWYDAIDYDNLKGILIFFTFNYTHAIIDYTNDDVKFLFI